ncbi:MAG TPA: hypothetical protein VGB64_12035 [Actinomycetota bacterium]
MRSVRRDPDERGATAIVVALTLVMIMAAAMLTIDAGMLWTRRRTVTTASDAAALAEARAIALAGSPATVCGSSWTTLIARNTGSEAEPLSCAVVRGTVSGQGSVEVRTQLRSPIGFGRVLGLGDQQAFASSVARFDAVSVMLDHTRPMGICTQNDHLTEWFSYLNGTTSPAQYSLLRGSGPNHPLYGGAGVVHRIGYTKEQPLACGAAPGNWGFVNLNGGATSTGDLRRWIRDGYNENGVAVGDCNADNATADDWCPATPGTIATSVANELDSIVGVAVPLPLFDQVRGAGATAEYHITGFLGVILRGYRITGDGSGRYLDLEFTSLIGSGRCCPRNGTTVVDGGVRVVRLCSVDHDPISVATRCR